MAVMANVGPELRNTVSRQTIRGREPERAFVGAPVDRSLAGATHLRQPGATALLPDVALHPEVLPNDRRRLAIRILIVDDCTLYRENLAVALSQTQGLTAHVAWDMASLLCALESGAPDVVLLSMSTKDSAELLRKTTSSRPGTRVIAVGVWEGDESTIVDCAEAGVTGYHLRDESFGDLLSLIDKVAEGDSVCSPRVAAVLLRRLSKLAAGRKPDSSELVLTTREVQILRMLEMGLSNREIAEQLCIALHTVKNHVHSVLGKLGVSTRAQAVAVSRSVRGNEISTRDPGNELV